jgi:hypothetical protein
MMKRYGREGSIQSTNKTPHFCFLARMHARKHTHRETHFNASDNSEVDRR